MDEKQLDVRVMEPPPGLADEARRRGMHVAVVMLYEPNGESAGVESLHFFTITPFLPSAGDHIVTENNRICQVVRTLFGISKAPLPTGEARMLIPHIIAILLPDEVIGKPECAG
jgi:hypothetical protein